MKKILLMLLTLLPLLSMAQQMEIPKNSDKIIVINQVTAEENFKKAKQILADMDVAIATQDRDTWQIKSGEIRQTDNVSYRYLINCRDNKVSITGTWGTNIGINVGGITQGPSTYVISYKGAVKIMFNKMNDFAKQLGGELTYESSKAKAETKTDSKFGM
jgi:hypothetical protein